MILGAGGHGRVVAEIALLSGKYTDIAFLDDKAPDTAFPYAYVDKCEVFANYLGTCDFFVAIGNAAIRCRLQTEVEEAGGNIITSVIYHFEGCYNRQRHGRHGGSHCQYRSEDWQWRHPEHGLLRGS